MGKLAAFPPHTVITAIQRAFHELGGGHRRATQDFLCNIADTCGTGTLNGPLPALPNVLCLVTLWRRQQ